MILGFSVIGKSSLNVEMGPVRTLKGYFASIGFMQSIAR